MKTAQSSDKMNNRPQRDNLVHITFDPQVHAQFSTQALETYAFRKREAIVIDLMTLVAAVEYIDRTSVRSTVAWRRSLNLTVPVYELQRWESGLVAGMLKDTLSYLSGDEWNIEFVQRTGSPPPNPQESLSFENDVQSVMAYSDGLDSRAVSGIINAKTPGSLQRVRVGRTSAGVNKKNGRLVPFTKVPYKLNLAGRKHLEPSARTRGFKFAVIAGIAAYLAEVSEVVVPESGQGIFGPALLPYVHAYADYRNYPLFTYRVQNLFTALLDHSLRFSFPQLWFTKAETLTQYFEINKSDWWKDTQSCWQDARWSSFKKRKRQCGLCAACMFRRMSLHAANLEELPDRFLSENLSASTLEMSFPDGYKVRNGLRAFAIAGILQLDHLTDLNNNHSLLEMQSNLLSPVIDLPQKEVIANLKELLIKHSLEWDQFVKSQGSSSFLNQIVGKRI